MDTFIACHACRARMSLDVGPAAALAEMASFCAAHSRHPDGVGFELLFQAAPAARSGAPATWSGPG